MSSAAIWAVTEVSFPSTCRHLAKQGKEGHPGVESRKGRWQGIPSLATSLWGVTGRASLFLGCQKSYKHYSLIGSEWGWRRPGRISTVAPAKKRDSVSPCAVSPGSPAGMPIEGFSTLFLQTALNASLPSVGPRHISKCNVWLPKWEAGAKHPAAPWLALALAAIWAKCLQLKIHHWNVLQHQSFFPLSPASHQHQDKQGDPDKELTIGLCVPAIRFYYCWFLS